MIKELSLIETNLDLLEEKKDATAKTEFKKFYNTDECTRAVEKRWDALNEAEQAVFKLKNRILAHIELFDRYFGLLSD